VREVELKDATDTTIWDYAKQNGFVIVSKDSDFQQRSFLLGHPPKFIWLRLGNCPVLPIQELLRSHSAAIHAVEESSMESHLMLP
jgi:predicted nuclease of predicted toxin-antitoxin system